jgi:uncharacterized alpha-E superfamily protein
MLSRAADSVFWMSRYLERAENVARFIDVNCHLTLDLGEAVGEQWAPLVHASGDWNSFAARYGHTERDDVLRFLTFDAVNPNSILSCLQAARSNARQVREILPAVMWEEINKFYLLVQDAAAAGLPTRVYDFYQQIKLAAHLVAGVADATMAHGEAWHFARLGRLVERADNTSRIVDVKYFLLLPTPGYVGTPLDLAHWLALLKSASALEMYRQAHGRIEPLRVAEFLILDRAFPRSVRFCLVKAEESLHAITSSPPGTFRHRSEQRLGRLRAELDYTSIADIVDRGVHEFIDDLQGRLNGLGAAIYQDFFALGSAPHAVPAVLQEARQ